MEFDEWVKLVPDEITQDTLHEYETKIVDLPTDIPLP